MPFAPLTAPSAVIFDQNGRVTPVYPLVATVPLILSPHLSATRLNSFGSRTEPRVTQSPSCSSRRRFQPPAPRSCVPCVTKLVRSSISTPRRWVSAPILASTLSAATAVRLSTPPGLLDMCGALTTPITNPTTALSMMRSNQYRKLTVTALLFGAPNRRHPGVLLELQAGSADAQRNTRKLLGMKCWMERPAGQ